MTICSLCPYLAKVMSVMGLLWQVMISSGAKLLKAH